jgi:hypothetical protein
VFDFCGCAEHSDGESKYVMSESEDEEYEQYQNEPEKGKYWKWTMSLE